MYMHMYMKVFIIFGCYGLSDRPDIWFSVRVLKGLRVMEIPFLRNWIHSLVMDVFTTCKKLKLSLVNSYRRLWLRHR